LAVSSSWTKEKLSLKVEVETLFGENNS
jgi:hypothetical protein